MRRPFAFFTVHDQDKTEQLVEFAHRASQYVGIASSGGTARYLLEHGVNVTTVRQLVASSMQRRLTGVKLDVESKLQVAEALAGDAILGHRVVTLRPEVFGPILAKPEMTEELESLGMCEIVMVRTGFYPLETTLCQTDVTVDAVLEQTDIGGPAGIMAAVKGQRLPVIDSDDHVVALKWLETRDEGILLSFQAKAASAVSNYYGALANFLEARWGLHGSSG